MSTPSVAMRMTPRPKYLSLATMAMQQAAMYRINLLLNVLTNLAWLAALYYVWRTVLADQSRVGGFDWDEMRTYVLVSYAVNGLMSWTAERRTSAIIRSGQIAVDMTRPVDFQTQQIAQVIGFALVEGLVGMILAMTLGFAVLEIRAPASAVAGAVFVVSVASGFLVKALIGYMTGLLSFWTQNGVGLMWARAAVTNVFSGALIPLALFPGWLQEVAEVLPFQAVISTPLRIYLGDVSGFGLVAAVALQIAWVVALWLLARLLWVPAVRTLTVQGG